MNFWTGIAWPGVEGRPIGLVYRERVVNHRTSQEVIYFISSLPPRGRALARHVRDHWKVENQMHWSLDVTFAEDTSRIRKGEGAANGVASNTARSDCPGTINCPITGEEVCKDECPLTDANRSDWPGQVECPITGELICRDRCPLESQGDATTEDGGIPACCRHAKKFVEETSDRDKKPAILMHDLDTKYIKEFQQTVEAAGMKTNPLPKASPNLKNLIVF